MKYFYIKKKKERGKIFSLNHVFIFILNSLSKVLVFVTQKWFKQIKNIKCQKC